MIFLNFILILILALIVFLGCIFLATPLFSKVPFIPVRKKILTDIISVLNLSNESILYDLGCGDGRVLFAAAQNYKDLRCIGIEKAPFPFLLAKVRQFFSGNKRVLIIHGDMFHADTYFATHIFLYLFPKIMDSLLPKFEKELRRGTRVVSCDFKFSKRKPDAILELKNSRQFNRTLYIYNF